MLVKEKEQALVIRETAISADKSDFDNLVETEVQRRVASLQQEHKISLEKLEILVKEKNKELKRMKESFDTVKVANDSLRKEVRIMLEKCQKLYIRIDQM